MRFKNVLIAAAATSMVASPALAAAANPAASLSVARTARASTTGEKANKLAGAGIIAAILAAGIIAIPVIAIVNDSDDNSDSN